MQSSTYKQRWEVQQEGMSDEHHFGSMTGNLSACCVQDTGNFALCLRILSCNIAQLSDAMTVSGVVISSLTSACV